MKSWSEKLLVWGTCALVLVLPIVYFNWWYVPHVTSKMIVFYGIVELLFTAWLYRVIVDPSYCLTSKQWLAFSSFILYIAWFTIAGVLGVDFESSFWSSLGRGTGLLTLYHVVAFSIVIAALVRKFGVTEYGYKFLGYFVSGSGLGAISIWLGNEGFGLVTPALELSKGGGLIGNSSLAAGYLIFGFFFAVILAVTKNIKRWMKVVSWMTIFLIIFSPLFLNLAKGFSVGVSARGAAFGIPVGIMFAAGAWIALSQKKSARITGIVLMIIFLCSLGVGFRALMDPSARAHEQFVESAGEGRFIFWNAAREGMREHSLFGYGPENFRVAYQEHFDPKIFTVSTAAEVWIDRAHNNFFDTGVAGGWPAVVWYVALLVSLGTEIYRAHVRRRLSRTQASLLAGLLVAYIFQNLFVFDSFMTLVSFGVLVGCVFGASGEPGIKTSVQSKSGVIILMSIVFIGLFIPFVWTPARKVVRFAHVLELPLDKRADHYSELLRGSQIGNPSDVAEIAEASYMLYADADSQRRIRSEEKLRAFALRDIDALIAYLETIAAGNPTDYRLRLNIARLYNQRISFAGDLDGKLAHRASLIETEALALAPNDPQIYWTTAVTKFRAGDKEGARTSLQKALELAPYLDFTRQLMAEMKL